VLDYKFELLRTIHTGIVAVAEWYNFRIPTTRLDKGVLMQACRNRRNSSLRETKSSHAHDVYLHTFAYGHSHYGPVHHRRRFQRRFWCIQKVGVECSTAKVCKKNMFCTKKKTLHRGVHEGSCKFWTSNLSQNRARCGSSNEVHCAACD